RGEYLQELFSVHRRSGRFYFSGSASQLLRKPAFLSHLHGRFSDENLRQARKRLFPLQSYRTSCRTGNLEKTTEKSYPIRSVFRPTRFSGSCFQLQLPTTYRDGNRRHE